MNQVGDIVPVRDRLMVFVTQVGDIITVRGRPERVVEVEMILRDEKPFYVALRTEPLEEDASDAAQAPAL